VDRPFRRAMSKIKCAGFAAYDVDIGASDCSIHLDVPEKNEQATSASAGLCDPFDMQAVATRLVKSLFELSSYFFAFYARVIYTRPHR
jgi:hypothetical protein